MITVCHGGIFGDIIYACPAMRALAEKHGGPVDLVIYPFPRERRLAPTYAMTPASVEVIAPLLLAQPYIASVRYAPAPQGTPLDEWRQWYASGINLAVAHLLQVEENFGWSLIPWLNVPEPTRVAPVVFHRSKRYRNDAFPWGPALEAYGANAVMVGHPDEHEAFCREVGYVPYHRTANLLELARVIAGARLFVGNQSSPYAIAEGLKQNTIQEVWPGDANCVFPRGNATYGIDERTPMHRLPPAWTAPVSA